MNPRVFALAALSAAALVPAAHGTTRAHPDTTIPDVFLTIHVTLTDARISLDRHSAGRGDEVRFIIRNAGTKIHNFTLGTTQTKGAGAQTGFSTTLRPKQQKLNLLFLDYRGPLPYHSAIRADRNKPGMKGIFTIR
jgi:hypothetical protein